MHLVYAHPTAIHELEVKCIIHYYLNETKQQGLILHPSANLILDMHVDSDFAGMWHKAHTHLPYNVLSQTGYVILYGSCPITWANKLQTAIALSVTKSKYITLSTATWDLLPTCQLIRYWQSHLHISPKENCIRDYINPIIQTIQSLCR